MQKLISIIVPVFNVQSYLPKCLQSIVSQTYQNLEILLIDDGSTDNSGMICDEWAERDSRIRVIHTENRGVAAARNEGLKFCTGELIGFIDADDWIEKDMYMCLSEACESADMAACGWVSYSAGTNEPIYCGGKNISTRDFEEAVIQVYESRGYFTSICNKLFRRNVIWQEGSPTLLEHDLYIGEDELWLIKVMKNCDSFTFISKPYYHYRPRIGSATRIKDVTPQRMTVLTAESRVIQELEGYKRAAVYAKGVMYNGCFYISVQNYIQGDEEKRKYIQHVLKPVKPYWLASPAIPIISKLKVILLELEMKLRLPVNIVAATCNARRQRK